MLYGPLPKLWTEFLRTGGQRRQRVGKVFNLKNESGKRTPRDPRANFGSARLTHIRQVEYFRVTRDSRTDTGKPTCQGTTHISVPPWDPHALHGEPEYSTQ